jgi:hypothetical protein
MEPLAAMQKIKLALLGVLLTGILGVSLASMDTSQIEAQSTSQDTCPPARENARTVMEDFLTGSSWADARQEVGATGFSAGDIYRLRDPEDTGMCEKLWDKSPSSNGEEIAWVYYRTGSYFFIVRVPKEKPSPEDLNLYGDMIEVYRTTSLEPKGAFLR